MILKSVELFNIRSHEHCVFDPLKEGMTVISGPTGSGKSTIVDAFAWVLFGTRPKGVSKNSAMIREGANLKEEKCSATVELYVDGSLLKIQRKILNNAGKVACNVWRWENEDWAHLAGEAVSQAESYVRNLLKMDEKGFLASTLVQQKQVDQLVSAGASDRAKVVEQLTGISSITTAVTLARQEQNAFKKSVELSTVDKSELSGYQEELDRLEACDVELSSKYEVDLELGKNAKSELAELENNLAEEEAKFEKTSEARKKIDSIDAKLSTLEKAAQDATKERAELKLKVTEGKSGSLEQATAKLNKLRSVIADDNSSVTLNNKKLKSLNAQFDEKQECVDNLKNTYEWLKTSDSEAVEEKLDSLNANIAEASKRMVKLVNGANSLDGEISQIQNAIKVVSKGDNCPTCLQKVPHVEIAVEALNGKLSEISKKKQMCLDKASVLETKVEGFKEELVAVGNYVALVNTLDEIVSEREEVTDAVKTLNENLVKNKKRLKELEVVHSKLEEEATNARLYKSASARLQEIVNSVDKLKNARVKYADFLKSNSSLSESRMTSLRKEAYDARTSFQQRVTDMMELKSELKLNKSEIAHMKDKIENITKEIDKHKQLIHSLEVSTLTLDTLTEFRANRVRTVLPAIESTASELLKRFTDGKFVNLILDEKFNASVRTNSGAVRPVGMLSGGELSAAAIALRVAISVMLNNGEGGGGLIILDEVLVSQDSDRSMLILYTIEDVCKGQVVIIAHNDSVAAVADKKVELVGS